MKKKLIFLISLLFLIGLSGLIYSKVLGAGNIDIDIVYPVNDTIYTSTSLDLNWTVNTTTDWCAYSLDEGTNNTFYDWCYQETANVSTACGGLDSGSYFGGDDDEWRDGNWSYLSDTITFDDDVYVNYTKPNGASSDSKWIIAIYDGEYTITPTNYSIPSSCWEYDSSKLVFMIEGWSYFNGHITVRNENYTCYNGTGYEVIYSEGRDRVFEEAMWWNITSNTTLTSLSESSHNITVYCNDTAGNIGQSDYILFSVNSTPTTPNILSPIDGNYYTSVDLNFTSTDVTNDALTFWVYINSSTPNSTSTNFTSFLDDDGNYSLIVSADDGTSNSTNSSTIYFYLDNTAPTYSNNITNATATTPKIYDWLQMNLTLTDSYKLDSYIFSWNGTNGSWFNDSVNAVESSGDLCYQESANVSTACGGLDTGVYGYDGDWIGSGGLANLSYDGDWDTSVYPTSGGLGGSGNVYINYTKPLGALNSSLWRIKDSHFDGNKSIPFSCWSQDILQFNISMPVISEDITWYCRNNTGWEIIRDYHVAPFGSVYLFEEAMWWNITPSETNISISKQINISKGTVGYMVYSNDTLGNSGNSSVYYTEIANTNPTLKTDLAFTNFSIGHSFNVTTTFTDLDTASDISSYNITTTLGICTYISNSTSGDDFTIKYNCTGTALQTAYIQINVTDLSNVVIGSSNLSNVFPNNLPTITSADINDTTPTNADDLNCTVNGVNDLDLDTVQLSYDWYNGSDWLDINNSILTSGNLSSNDVWKCKVIPNDGYVNGSAVESATVSIGTSFQASIINWTNATTSTTTINSSFSNPTNNNSWLNLSVMFEDVNADETFTAYFCDTSSTSKDGCAVNTLGISEINSTDKNLSVRYNVSGLTSSTYDYYTFIVDNNSMVSSSTKGTFHVNHQPSIPTLIQPLTNISVNHTIVNFSSTDSDSDTINYTIYNSSDSLTWSQLNITTTVFNWTDISDGIHYLKAYSTDEHGYSVYTNSSIYNFTSDTTAPTLTNISVSSISAYTTTTITFSVTAEDLTSISPSDCKFELYKADSTPTSWNITANSKVGNIFSKPQTMATYGTGTLEFRKVYCTDSFGNTATNSSVDTNLSITTYTAPTPPSGGGGGGSEDECSVTSDCLRDFGINYYCSSGNCVLNTSKLILPTGLLGPCNYNGICEPNIGEDFFNCRADLRLGKGILPSDELPEGSGDCTFGWDTLVGTTGNRQGLKFLMILSGIVVFMIILLNFQKVFKPKERYKIIKRRYF